MFMLLELILVPVVSKRLIPVSSVHCELNIYLAIMYL